MDERRLLRLLEAALSVSEYTGGAEGGGEGSSWWEDGSSRNRPQRLAVHNGLATQEIPSQRVKFGAGLQLHH